MLAQTDALLATCREAMKTQQIHQVLNAVWAVVAEANRYFAAAAPWALRKTDPPRMEAVLYVTAEVVRQVAILAQPAMPEAAASCSTCWRFRRRRAALPRSGPAAGLQPASPCRRHRPVFPRYVEGEDRQAG